MINIKGSLVAIYARNQYKSFTFEPYLSKPIMKEINAGLALQIVKLKQEIDQYEKDKLEMRENILLAVRDQGSLPSLAALLTLHTENLHQLMGILKIALGQLNLMRY